jgi:hypothetical protein
MNRTLVMSLAAAAFILSIACSTFAIVFAPASPNDFVPAPACLSYVHNDVIIYTDKPDGCQP